MDIKKTLQERGKTHGNFSDNAAISQRFKEIIRDYDGNLSDVQKEALDMIVHKIARILCGNPNHKDAWHDLSGYATLAENRIE
ncbi:MAG: hypothetical protein KBD16_00705 [Candidatus Pacebacteria bacterium]|nr:hypothetical protein [Candidatus Paceibacterota bacterium]